MSPKFATLGHASREGQRCATERAPRPGLAECVLCHAARTWMHLLEACRHWIQNPPVNHDMTPAITAARKAAIAYTLHEYEHDPKARSFGLEAAQKLGFDPQRVFKTLIVELDTGALAVAIIPVSAMLNMKHCARAAGARKAALAERSKAERATGYVMGGISPLGQKKRLTTIIDTSALAFDTVYVSGGRRGLDLELAPEDLLRLLNATTAELC